MDSRNFTNKYTLLGVSACRVEGGEGENQCPLLPKI